MTDDEGSGPAAAEAATNNPKASAKEGRVGVGNDRFAGEGLAERDDNCAARFGAAFAAAGAATLAAVTATAAAAAWW